MTAHGCTRIRRVDGMGLLVYVPSFDGSWPRNANKFFADGEHLIRLGRLICNVYDGLSPRAFSLMLSPRHRVCMIIDKEER